MALSDFDLDDPYNGPSLEYMATASQEEVDHWLNDWKWRVSHIYTIVDKTGSVVQFRPNRAQRHFMDNIHGSDIILKARQLGFSTLIEMIFLDTCMWVPNVSAGVITITESDGIKLLREKVRDVYKRLPEELREMSPLKTESATLLEWENGSSIAVGISHRGGTLQLLHVSELGKIAARFPQRALEIKTGAFNTVAPGQIIIVESTAEGQEGLFYEICAEALNRQRAEIEPLEGEFDIKFYPWFEDPAYRMETDRAISKEMKTYFKGLQQVTGRAFDREQVNWYQLKRAQQGNMMKREFPSTPEEAFEASVEGAIFKEEIERVYDQQRIGSYPYDASLGAVYTFWDIGRADHTVILLAQRVSAGSYQFFDMVHDHGKSLPHYVEELNLLKYKYRFNWGLHVLPHDGNNHEFLSVESRKVTIENALRSFCEVIPRAKNIFTDIEMVRPFWEASYFDAQGCGDFMKMAQNYRWRRDERLQTWMPKPEHNEPSHFVDAYRTAAAAHRLNIIDQSEYGPSLVRDTLFARSGAGGY